MSFATTLLCLSTLLPSPQGPDLKLPPKKAESATPDPQEKLSDLERFRKDVAELAAQPARADLLLQAMAMRYQSIEVLLLEAARGARQKEMRDLMPVARRFGSARVADELRFQLLARPLGGATREVVDAMVFLMGPERDPDGALDEKAALRQCIRGSVASVRRPATEVLAELAGEDDLPFALALSSERSLDLQLRGVDLLRAIGNEGASGRLVKLLSKGPALAGHACEALIQLGERASPALRELLEGPPIDRGYCYAAFALAEIGDQRGERTLTEGLVIKLKPQLRSGEPVTRCLAAIALADLTYHGRVEGTAAEASALDVAIGDELLEIVEGRQFVPNLDLLRRPAEVRLLRMTGRFAADEDTLSWREWWRSRRAGFVGIRSAVKVTAENAPDVAITLHTGREVIKLLGEGLADRPPGADTSEVVLTTARMLTLVGELEALGFGSDEAMRFETALPIVRSLELAVGPARAQAGAPAQGHMVFDGLVARIESEVARELWQLFRQPQDEADRGAFWRAEHSWLEGHPDEFERGRRFGRRVFRNWSVVTPRLRARALEHLFARADRASLFDESDGDSILAIIRRAGELRGLELRLLELAAGLPGDRIWRECVDLAARAGGDSRDAVRAVFAVLGPDAVLSALEDERALVRRVAIDEAVVSRDQRAGPKLVAMLEDADVDVQRAAAHACGQLRIVAAREPLVALILASGTPQVMRYECMHALGRVGGEQAFGVLDRALRSPVLEDRAAAIKGLGELRDLRAAHTLAELAVIAHGSELGNLARLYLGRMGAAFAVPALRQQARIVQDPAIQVDLVLLLGAYQDPTVVPDLMGLMRMQERSREATQALMCTTGVDLLTPKDPWLAIEDWWFANRAKPQWQWLLDALEVAEVPHVLRPEHFGPGVGLQPVPELARLLTELEQPRLFVLVAAVLRDLTKQDYGVVTPATEPPARAGIAGRYRLLVE